MAEGPGKYDYMCTLVREVLQASGLVLVVIEGQEGSGFSVQGDRHLTEKLPDILETMARSIRDDLQRKGDADKS